MAVIPIENDKHWRQLRMVNVGGSEIAALFGACSYLTHLELWLIKRGEAAGDIEDSERMFWGRMHEETIAQALQLKHGLQILNPRTYYTCDDVEGMGCTPDRVGYKPGCHAPGLVQIKVVDRLEFLTKWENEEPPLMYQLQLQHELACTGLTWGMLAVLVGGNELKIYEYDAHDGAISKIKIAVAEFWRSVNSDESPKAVADDYEILKELYPAQEHKIIDLTADNHLPDLCARALAAGKRRKEATQEEKQAKAEVLQKLGDAGRAKCQGFMIKKTAVHKETYMVEAQHYHKLTIKEEKVA